LIPNLAGAYKGAPGIYKLPRVIFFFGKALSTPHHPCCLPNKVCLFHPSFEEIPGYAPGAP